MSEQYKFSFSKLSTYLQCPKMYELQFIKKVVEFKETIYTAFGGAIHKAIETCINKNYDFEETFFIFEKEFKERMKLMDPRESQLIFLNEWNSKAKEILKFYFENYNTKIQKGLIEVIGVEKYFSYEILPNVFYNGIIDLLCKCEEEYTEKKQIPTIKKTQSGKERKIYETIINKNYKTVYKILDWKTGSVKQDKTQLLSYTVPLFFLEKMLVDEISYIYLKHQKEVKESINENKIKETKEYLISIIKNIIRDTENNDFEMCLDKKICKYCNVKKFCNEEFESDLGSM